MIRLHRSRTSRTRGQSALENALVISVLTVAVVGASFLFVPSFRTGTGELSKDVYAILNGGTIGNIGQTRGGSGGAAVDAGSGRMGGPISQGSGDSGPGTNFGGRPDSSGDILGQANGEMSQRGTGDIGESRKETGNDYPASSPALGAVTGDFGIIGNQ